MDRVLQNRPHECAISIQITTIIGSIFFMLLLFHSAYILLLHRDNDSSIDSWLRFSIIIRFILALPRPFMWYRIFQMHGQARTLVEPQVVSEQLIRLHHSPVMKGNLVMSQVSYFWMLVNTIIAFTFRNSSDLCRHLSYHCFLNIIILGLMNFLRIVIFVFVSKPGFVKKISITYIEKNTKKITWESNIYDSKSDIYPTDCSICCMPYEESDIIRILPCSHWFHMECIDKWLTEYQSSCPLCKSTLNKGKGSLLK
eukprot:NODE_6171_length_917_cov_32.732997_g5580_i0.p1 GENE.NODE_6171_length_917_cov_32.732997_g5580_i0~~NODE_6171_length_917_cov_32.732997_g5580_i0.p1  ORF type:complete len:255 (-),score=6.61 NODE_6171_length_917_cov_32.732997_g5580_i0:87-851(-)